MLTKTVTLGEASRRIWDVVVVGAGPAGALAARGLAAKSMSVLLVDQSAFPRRKVCGSCLNRAALAILEEVGLERLPFQLGAQLIRQLQLVAGSRRTTIPLERGVALSREALDTALIREAIQKGAEFLPQTRAALDCFKGSTRRLTLCQGEEQVSLEARVILAANGLGGNFLKNEEGLGMWTAPASRIGVSAIAGEAPQFYASGTIYMACGRSGYVGLVRLEDGKLNIAAALDLEFVKQARGPARATAAILKENGLPSVGESEILGWRGTPGLTRRRLHLAAERLFILGDAAGYVEPFTGEGIAWALASGARVVPLALEAARAWESGLAIRWTQLYSRLIGRRQKICRWVTRLLRQTELTHLAVRLLLWKPSLATPLIRSINAPFQ